MAILEKRKSVNKLPRFQRYQDTRAGDRSAALRGETPITSAIRQLAGSSGYGPMGQDQGFNPMGGRGGMGGVGPTAGGAGKSGVDKFGNMAGQPKTAVTSALKGSTAGTKTATAATKTAGTTSKLPSLTSKTTGTTGKTLTSTGTGAAKTTGTKMPVTTGTKTSGSTGSKLTSALAGAALGAGTKLAIDKLTGAKKVTSGTDKTSGTTKDTSKVTSKTSGTGLTSKTNTLGTDIGKKIVNDTGVKKVVDTTKTGTRGIVDTAKKVVDTTKTGTKGVVDTTKAGTKVTGPTSLIKGAGTPITKTAGPKTPVGTGSKTPVGAGPKTPSGGSKATAPATKGAAVTAKTAADIKTENPELTEEEVEAELNRVRDEEGSLGIPEGAEDNGDGTYSETVDGMTTTYDANGNVLGVEAAEDVVDGVDGDDTLIGGDGNDTLDDGTDTTTAGGLTRSLGNTVTDDTTEDLTGSGYFTDDEGNVYDAEGNFVSYADGSTDEIETADDEVAYTDDYGNTYDSNGDLIAEGDHSDYVYTAEDGSTYDYDGNLIAEADHSGFLQYDDEGNAYDYDGNFVSYAEGYTPEDEYTSEDEYGFEDEYSGEDEYEEEYEEDAKGGLIGMRRGGAPVHMQEGGDPDEEDGEPIGEEENEDGTITQYFDDGSSITYDADGEVTEVTEATEDEEAPAFATRGITVGAGGQRYENPLTAADYQAESRLTGANPTRLQSFLDDIPRTNAVADGESTGNEGQGTGLDFTPEGFPEGFVSNGDGTATYVDDDGSTITIDADNNIVFVTDANGDTVVQNNEPVTTTGGLTQAGQGNRQYFDDGSSIETFDDGSTVTYDSDGNVFKATNAYETTYDDEGNAIVTDGFGNIVSVYDPQGNVIPLGGGRVTGPTQVTGAGDEGAVDITKNPTVQQRREEQELDKGTQSAIDSLLAGLNTYGGAGAAGAVLGALLSDTDLFGGGTGSTGGNFDMTGVGAIDPRTTDFGIGPANYVGYDEYGTPEQMPELYGNELYQNLNAPGFNEVNPGDYARMDAEEFGDPVSEDIVEEEGMASGGQPQGGLGQTYPQTYYTFGKPVDPLENLRNPMPFQQPQGQPKMPPQAAQNAQQAPQAMPPMGMTMAQGMPTQMRRGGLPHASNVPMTQGRMDFRRGAAVHGAGDGQSDDIPAMLADGEYVIDAETVAQIGNGSTKAGAQALDKFRENIRMHKRSAPINKIPPKTKALTSYLKGAR